MKTAIINDITSPQNPLVKLARALDRKKERKETGLFRAEGARLVKEGVDLGWRLYALLFSGAVEGRPHVKDLLASCQDPEIKIGRVNDKILESITHRDNAQSVVGIFYQQFSILEEIAAEDLIVALERPKDPGNLGTIIRTLDSVGGKSIILLEDACDPFSVEAVRSTMGSLFSVKIVKSPIKEFLNWEKQNDFTLVGTSLKAHDLHTKTNMGMRTILLMGNEQSGIDDDLADSCDELIKLPMKGRADSLNLAIATGISLYEIWRQRDFNGKNL
jgi:TrmH family RNA methyltransferase